MIFPALALLLAVPAIRTPDPVGPKPTPELVATVGPTRFTAVNTTNHAQLVVLGATDGVASAHAIVPAHGVLRCQYPRGTTDALWIDFASLAPDGVRHTGPIELAELVGADSVSVEFAHGQGFTFAQRGTSSVWVPARDAHGNPWPTRPLFSTHVPVPKPIDPKKGEKPPQVGDTPLEVF